MKNVKVFRGLTLVIIQILLVSMLAGCGGNSGTQTVQARNVKVAKASISSIGVEVEYPGKLKPAEEIIASPKIGGRVESVNFDVGKSVKKGDILFTLEKKEAQAQYNQSKAALDSAKASLVRASDSSISQQVIQAQAAVDQAQVQYDDAKTYYDKTRDLYDSVKVSKQELDNAESKMKNASIQLDTAKKNLDLLKSKIAPQSVNVASTQVEQAKAATELASLQLDNTIIISPISGTVSVKNIDVGEVVGSGNPAITVIDDMNLIAEVNVPDKMIDKIRNGQVVKVKANISEDKTIEGVVDSISPNTDPRMQNYIVKIKIDNSSKELKPGMFAGIKFTVENRSNILTVQNEALVTENGVQYVYLVSGNKIKKIPVETGIADNNKTEIVKSLKEGDSVVIEGQNFLNDGDQINIVN